MKWTQIRATYTDSDLASFEDLGAVGQCFGLPLKSPSRIFSRFLRPDGGVPLPVREIRRSGAFGHYVAYRLFAEGRPEVWIWNERYWFCDYTGRDRGMLEAQEVFRGKFGETRLKIVRDLANARGLRQTCKTGPGLPDLAVFVPGFATEWRFVEIKMPERNDELSELQIRWLELLADAFGRGSAVELELVAAAQTPRTVSAPV